MRNPGKRLSILTAEEIQELYGLPNFTYEDKIRYFTLTAIEIRELDSFRTTKTKMHFILQLGYFKARRLFFTFQYQQIREDVQYIQQQIFPEKGDFQDVEISKPSRLLQQQTILELFGYQHCTPEIRKKTARQGYTDRQGMY